MCHTYIRQLQWLSCVYFDYRVGGDGVFSLFMVQINEPSLRSRTLARHPALFQSFQLWCSMQDPALTTGRGHMRRVLSSGSF